ncbi:MAG: hypothetical protein M1823_005794 [Watsoniomyces obsoletus]|nr:MAG: hypothetical protein M1823_005794 [Watsoniomyces obsoletus]
MSRPLLASRASSEDLDDRAHIEEEALLTGWSARSRYGWKFWREVALFAWATLATVAVIVIAVLYQHMSEGRDGAGDGLGSRMPTGKRNLIFMVSDGMGPTSLSLARSFRQFEAGLGPDDVLELDRHLIGSSRTRSTSSLVTDSAAGATAFSCGLKSYNGAISILPNHQPCGTVMEAAKEAGYRTGLVVTTRLTDATPACFAAHVPQRSQEDRIAEQEVGEHPLGRVVDLMLGGGRCHFLPNNTDGSCRDDDKDVVALAQHHGFSYIDDRAGFDDLKMGASVRLPLLGLVANRDIPYEVDRQSMQDRFPSLDEMARTALEALTRATEHSEQGFFLMIEGSRIDHAGHANDPVAQAHEVLAYDKAFASVLDYIEKSKVETVVVSTSDHETGGLAVARQLHETYPEYLWHPTVLINASSSAEHLSNQLETHRAGNPQEKESELIHFINATLLVDGLGIVDASDEELKRLIERPEESAYLLADAISRRAQVGWTTHGHSAVDVNIYASGVSAEHRLRGNHENTEIGEFLRDYLGVDLDPITRRLQESGIGR